MPSVSLCMARRTRSANRSFGCGFTSAIAISGRYISGICRLCTRSSLAVRAEARNDVLRKPRHLGLEWLELQHEQLDACGLKIARSEEHTSELQSHLNLVCRLLLEKKR